jgi:uncharacterized membrane protein SpoIIM required for sporulation
VALTVSTLTEAAFAERRRLDWAELDVLVKRAQSSGLGKLTPSELSRIAPLYRDLCADLARAEASRYSAPLVAFLHGLTAASHTTLYGAHAKRRAFVRTTVRAAFEAFPRAVRAHKGAVFLAAALFFLPFIGGVVASLLHPDFAYRVVPETTLRPLTEAYARGFDEARGGGADAQMAGFYVNNNVGIALRCFALGVFGGLGSAFYLVQNGLSIGAILGYVAAHGAGDNIVTFVVGHGSFELGAIVLAGGAGLSIGWAIVAPGDQTRAASLQAAARGVVTIVFGAAVMLLIAASIEGFWSGSVVPAVVKRAVGGALFVLVILYLTLVGRREAPRWT